MNVLINGLLAELPTILDTNINATSAYIRVYVRQVWWGATINTHLEGTLPNGPICALDTKVAKSMDNITSQSCGDLQPGVGLCQLCRHNLGIKKH